ncbi:MAG: ShlB/FhaC/HecB family hemolysin secretion/activation protein [Gammaproteobacteria bacterium]
MLVLLLVAAAVRANGADETSIPQVSFTVTSFAIDGDNPLGDEATRLLDDYRGTYTGLDALLAAVDVLQQALADGGYRFHRAVLPQQTLDGGVVRIEIVAFTLGAIQVEGNTRFGSDNVRRSLASLRPGESPDPAAIGQAIELANRHPDKQVGVRLRESSEANAIDAVVTVSDERPWSLFAGINNIGTKDTGRTRMSVGAQYSNLFDRDHEITASYTTSPENVDDVEQYAVSYRIPLYAALGSVSAFYSRSDVDVGEVGDFTVSGAGRFWGVSFNRLLRRRGGYRHEWSLGVQNRRFENEVDFLGFIPVGIDVRSYPVELGYSASYVARNWNASFSAAYARNLKVGDDNNDETYALTRFGADADWDVVRFVGAATRVLPRGWLLRATADGQWAGEAMIPGEQFGVGGWRSVRGLDERAVTGDNGLRTSAEVWTPPIARLHGLRLLAFFDIGYREREDALPGEVESDTVSSAGMGLRWSWRNDLSVTLDYGHTLAEGEGATSAAPDIRGVKWHFNVFYNF